MLAASRQEVSSGIQGKVGAAPLHAVAGAQAAAMVHARQILMALCALHAAQTVGRPVTLVQQCLHADTRLSPAPHIGQTRPEHQLS